MLTISGYVRDSNGIGVWGVRLTITGAGDNPSGSILTDINGYYSSSLPEGWSGTVTPSKTGQYVFIPPSRMYENLSCDMTDQDYQMFLVVYITGYVVLADNTKIGGATITFEGSEGEIDGTATSNDSGYYNKTVFSGWSGTATPSKIGYQFSPASRVYRSLIINISGQNYTATEV